MCTYRCEGRYFHTLCLWGPCPPHWGCNWHILKSQNNLNHLWSRNSLLSTLQKQKFYPWGYAYASFLQQQKTWTQVYTQINKEMTEYCICALLHASSLKNILIYIYKPGNITMILSKKKVADFWGKYILFLIHAIHSRICTKLWKIHTEQKKMGKLLLFFIHSYTNSMRMCHIHLAIF